MKSELRLSWHLSCHLQWLVLHLILEISGCRLGSLTSASSTESSGLQHFFQHLSYRLNPASVGRVHRHVSLEQHQGQMHTYHGIGPIVFEK
jgi:hypothetical protein